MKLVIPWICAIGLMICCAEMVRESVRKSHEAEGKVEIICYGCQPDHHR